MPIIPEWLRSVLITFAITFATFVVAADFDWTRDALLAAAITAARTAVSALLPGGSFGKAPVGGH